MGCLKSKIPAESEGMQFINQTLNVGKSIWAIYKNSGVTTFETEALKVNLYKSTP